VIGKIKHLGLLAAAGYTFLRLYTLPAHGNELPAEIRMQPAW
jgi:magnesium-protoporphyrin IX monomethyl ester (oxidative) cyclase